LSYDNTDIGLFKNITYERCVGRFFFEAASDDYLDNVWENNLTRT